MSNAVNSSLSEDPPEQNPGGGPGPILSSPSGSFPNPLTTLNLDLSPPTPAYYCIPCKIRDRSNTNARDFQTEATFRPGSLVSFISASAVSSYDIRPWVLAESFLRFFRSPIDDKIIRPTGFVKLTLTFPAKKIDVILRILEQECPPQLWIGDPMIAKHDLREIFPQISWLSPIGETQDPLHNDETDPAPGDHGIDGGTSRLLVDRETKVNAARYDDGPDSVLAYTGGWSEISSPATKPTTVVIPDDLEETEIKLDTAVE